MDEAETTVEETYTYQITLGVSTCYISSEVEETLPLGNYGYSDQDWDNMSSREKGRTLDDLIEQYVWENIDSWGHVKNENGEEV
jgi:hypothetical protein